MSEFFDERELEKKIKIEPHDYSKDIELLDSRMRKTQFAYLEAVKSKLKRGIRRATAFLLLGILIALAALLLSDYFPAYDMAAFIFLKTFLPIEYNPFMSFIAMLVPAVIVFLLLAWLYNRETKFYFYLAKKSSQTEKKTGFFAMLVGPFIILLAAIIASAILLTAFSFIGCQQMLCHFYDNMGRLSSSMLFNLLSLSFYLMLLGAIQLKRCLWLLRIGIKDLYEDPGL